MREIKFRAWDELNEVMHNDVEFIRSGTEVNDWIIFKSNKQTLQDKKVLDNPYFQQQIKLMQFTGLKNKKGIEIYEGSIIEFRTFDGLKYIGDIEYNDSELLYEVNTTDGTAPCLYLLRDVIDFETIEVIGNIHENKNLLK